MQGTQFIFFLALLMIHPISMGESIYISIKKTELGHGLPNKSSLLTSRLSNGRAKPVQCFIYDTLVQFNSL